MNTKELGHFVTTIPELRERMKKLEAHTNIAFALLEQIKARQLDNFYLLEEVSLRYVSFAFFFELRICVRTLRCTRWWSGKRSRRHWRLTQRAPSRTNSASC